MADSGKKRKRHASVWDHFSKTNDSGICNICNKVIKTTGRSTKGLHVHLETKHKIFLRQGSGAAAEVVNADDNEDDNSDDPGVVIPPKKQKITDYYASFRGEPLEEIISRMASVDGFSLNSFAVSYDLRSVLFFFKIIKFILKSL